MTEPIIEASIRLTDHSIRLQWGMPVDPERRRWLWKHRQLEVRLYCEPYLDFGKPIIQTMALDTRSITRGLTFNVPFPFVENIASLTSEATQSAYRPGLPAADADGRFYPVTFDLSPNDIPPGGIITYPVLEFPVVSSDWRSKPFSVWAVFGYQERGHFDSVSMLRQFDYRPEEPEVLLDLPLVTNAPALNRSLVQQLTPYLRWLHEESKRSGLLRVLNPRDPTVDPRGVTVDQVYTPLMVEQFSYQLRLFGSNPSNSVLNNLSLMNLSDKFERLVLLGDPGSGKSTFLQYLSLALTGHLLDPNSDWITKLQNQGWEQGERIPIVVILRDFAQDIQIGIHVGSSGLLFNHIERQLLQRKLEDYFPAIVSALENGWALVLFDGLDEVPDDRRELVRYAVMAFIQRLHPSNRYIVTCRILSYTNRFWKLPGMTQLVIAPFERKQIDHFVGAWYTALRELGALDEPTAEKRTQQLIAEMDNEQIARIAENPMLLTVMAIVHNHGEGRLPREIAVLYDECVKLLMEKWRKHEANRLMDTLDLREIDLYRILYQIAFKAHDEQADRAGAADIPETDVQDMVMQALDCDQIQAKSFCDYVEAQAGLLIGRGQARSRWRVFSFPHRTFQEFLAGCYIATNGFYELVPELIENGDKWRVAIMLGTGHLVFNAGDNSAVVTAIKNLVDEHTERADWQKVWLAGDMLALMTEQRARTVRRGESVIKATIDALVNLVEGGHLTPVERAATGRTLSVLGDPRPGVGLRPDGLPHIAWADEIPAGTYWIGGEARSDNPRRQITITNSFRVAKYLVTQTQYLAFQKDTSERGYTCPDWWHGLAATDRNKRPSQRVFPYANHPMESVNWYQAVAFSRWLTWHLRQAGLIAEGEEIRLPHEYEWEVAARGAEERIYSYAGDFDTSKCNVGETGIQQISAVGLFPDGESPCRALDMSGNVWEWCLNRYEDSSNELDGASNRVLRGGSWNFSDRVCFRCDFRLRRSPSYRDIFGGIRLALSS